MELMMYYWRFEDDRFLADDVGRDEHETMNGFIQRLGYIVSTDQEGKDVQVYIARSHTIEQGNPHFLVVHLVGGKQFYTRIPTYPDLVQFVAMATW
jgi:sulfur relay (sulfurtransferase) DsrC/TusE family protein